MITFEVHVRSDLSACNPVSGDRPFPGCLFNDEERRWEYKVKTVDTLVELARDLGMPLVVRPMKTTSSDLDVLEVIDMEEDAP